jgi:hypothetical protein
MRYTIVFLLALLFSVPVTAECYESGMGPGEWPCNCLLGPVRPSTYGSMRLEVHPRDLNGGTVDVGDLIEFTVEIYNPSSGNYGHYFRSCTPTVMTDRTILRGPYNWSMAGCDALDLSNPERLLVGMTAWSPCENPVWMRYTVQVGNVPVGTPINLRHQYVRTHNPYSLVLEVETRITVGNRLIPLISD